MSARFAILASGRGSNAEVLLQAFQDQLIPARATVVISDNEAAAVLQRVTRFDVAVECVSRRGVTRAAHETALLARLRHHQVEHILLCGYMRILSPHFLSRWNGHILNIHPSLLPDFPGLHAVERQWQARVRVAGATVHMVNEGVDTGPILLQGSLWVRGDEGPEGLAERLRTEVEHVIYPRAVVRVLEMSGRFAPRSKPHESHPLRLT